jgi:hypothetical protein
MSYNLLAPPSAHIRYLACPQRRENNIKFEIGWFKISKSGGPKPYGSGSSARKTAGLNCCLLIVPLRKVRRLTRGRRNDLGWPKVHGTVHQRDIVVGAADEPRSGQGEISATLVSVHDPPRPTRRTISTSCLNTTDVHKIHHHSSRLDPTNTVRSAFCLFTFCFISSRSIFKRLGASAMAVRVRLVW